MQLRWSVLVLVLLVRLVQGISTQDDYFAKCCKLGTSWASQKLKCDKFTGPVAGIEKADQGACLETVDICCRKAFQQQDCQLGKADAKAGLACSRSETGRRKAPIGLGDTRRDCCEGCKLGIKSGSSSKSCVKKVSFGEPWDPAFTECCEEKLTTTTRAVPTSKATAETTATTSTTEDDELNELFKEITDPTFSTQGDLCQLMKGLLCSDICVPTPGSYYCKCRDGSVLQSDGRSCESPTTTITAKKTTKTATTTTPKKATKTVTTTTPKKATKTVTTTTPKKATKTTAKKATTLATKPTTKVTAKTATMTTTTKATPKPTTVKATTKTTTIKSTPKATTKSSPKTTTKSKTTQNTIKDSDLKSPLTTLKLLTIGAKTRTTRALTTEEDNELNQTCPKGYRLNPASNTCDDIDECVDGSHNCGQERCYNLPGSFECAKAVLPAIKRRTTTTVDMGSRSNDGDNCSAGSKYDAERRGCVDVDECKEIKNICGSYEDCINTPGSFECRCKLGFRREDLTQACVDVNECLQDNDCLSSQRCDNTIGSYACVRFLSCGTGYTLNAATEVCEDDDECLMGTHNCPRGWHCINTLGNFRCHKDKKNPGDKIRTTTWPSRWTTKAPPPRMPPTTQRTTTTTYRPTITTTAAAQQAAAITTTTTTTERPATAITTTRRTIGPTSTTYRPWNTTTLRPWNTSYRSWSTTTAKPVWESTYRPTTTPKYYLNSTAYLPPTRARTTTTSTELIPTVGPVVTSRNWDWTTTRSPMTCPPGYETGSSGQCIDINECQKNPRICGPFNCINFMGSYKCEHQMVCPIGHRADPVTGECKDVDECENGRHECGPHQKCQNRPGGYFCFCPQGYDINGKECIDVNECTRFSAAGICGNHGRCENTPGSYRCTCESGFMNDPKSGACIDLDECTTKPNLCEHHCYNTWGGHRCGCNYGYRLRPDNRTCEDVDECKEFKDSNLCIGICENTPGSYACKCPEGYRIAEDGRACQDIDECATTTQCRGTQEICQNVRGSYRCNKINCPTGYIQDPHRKNRCMRESPFCPAEDTACFNRPAHYTYNYIAIVSMFPLPPSGEVELFIMRGAYNVPGSRVTFSMAFIAARAPPNVQPATEDSFSLNQHYSSQAVLTMTKSLQGPQDIELELTMEIYSPNGIFASAVAKIFIAITQYEF